MYKLPLISLFLSQAFFNDEPKVITKSLHRALCHSSPSPDHHPEGIIEQDWFIIKVWNTTEYQLLVRESIITETGKIASKIGI